MPKESATIFCNGWNDGYHFIIKEPEKEFKSQTICLRENNEKYITFTVLI